MIKKLFNKLIYWASPELAPGRVAKPSSDFPDKTVWYAPPHEDQPARLWDAPPPEDKRPKIKTTRSEYERLWRPKR